MNDNTTQTSTTVQTDTTVGTTTALVPDIKNELVPYAETQGEDRAKIESLITELDLSDAAYILFNGEVEIYPPQLDSQSFTICADCEICQQKVVGIRTEVDTIDGSNAKVLRDTVAVRIPHDTLLRILEAVSSVRYAWDSLWGLRHQEFARSIAR